MGILAQDISQLGWFAAPGGGVERKPLQLRSADSSFSAAFVRCRAGATVSLGQPTGRDCVYVMSGTCVLDGNTLDSGLFFRRSRASQAELAARQSCTLLVMKQQTVAPDETMVRIDVDSGNWISAGVSGWSRLPLSLEAEGARLDAERLGVDVVVQPQVRDRDEQIFLLEGDLDDGARFYRAPHLLELAGGAEVGFTSRTGAFYLVRRGHLAGERP